MVFSWQKALAFCRFLAFFCFGIRGHDTGNGGFWLLMVFMNAGSQRCVTRGWDVEPLYFEKDPKIHCYSVNEKTFRVVKKAG